MHLLESAPNITLMALSARFLTECGVNATTGMLLYFYIGEGIRFKKAVHASEQDRPDVAHRRMCWKNQQAQLDPRRLVFIDETWIKTNMARTHGHWQSLTFVGALRLDRLTAPCVIDGPIDGESFLAYVKHCLVPILTPGDMVVLDTLRSQKSQAVHTAIRKAGATRVLLPPYSPDLNPIEQIFAKIKSLLRKAAERTVERLWRTLGQLLETIHPTECANYFRNAGYAST